MNIKTRRTPIARTAPVALLALTTVCLTFVSQLALGDVLGNLKFANSESYGVLEPDLQANNLLIDDALARLLPPDASEYTRYQFEVNLKLADPSTVQAISQSATFDDAVDILFPGSDSQEAIAGTSDSVQMAIGSLNQDYVYTPVAPCRIADSRPAFGGPGTQLAGSTRSFFVYGPDMSSQGGNPAGCASPRGEPRAVHINVTVVGGGAGHLRVFPSNTVRPNASFVNFENGQVVANAGVIRTTFAIGPPEVSVYAAVNADVIIDVLGYFHEVGAIDPSLLPVTNLFTASFSDGDGVAAVLCPAGSIVVSANCNCDSVNGTRNFGVLFTCEIAGNGAIGGCFNEAGTFNPFLPAPLATVQAMCAQTILPGSATAVAKSADTDWAASTLAKPVPSETNKPEVDSALFEAMQSVQDQADSHTHRLRTKQ